MTTTGIYAKMLLLKVNAFLINIIQGGYIMKSRTLVIFLILVLDVVVITGGCATTSKTNEEREEVNQEVFLQSD